MWSSVLDQSELDSVAIKTCTVDILYSHKKLAFIE